MNQIIGLFPHCFKEALKGLNCMRTNHQTLNCTSSIYFFLLKMIIENYYSDHCGATCIIGVDKISNSTSFKFLE